MNSLNNTQYQYQYFERPLTIPNTNTIRSQHPNTTQYPYLKNFVFLYL